jgi:hypothetical protein
LGFSNLTRTGLERLWENEPLVGDGRGKGLIHAPVNKDTPAYFF